jgi:hypothetical protein
MKVRPSFAEFKALALLRTFVAGPATAQWAAVGEAPAPQLNDRSWSRPQRGNSRERLTLPAAHGHMSDRYTCWKQVGRPRSPCRLGPWRLS